MCVLGWLLVLLLGMERPATAQVLLGRRTPEEFGYRHLVLLFGKDSVDVLVQSKKGGEKLRKPLLLWCQGSLSTPLILVDKGGPYRVFPFINPAGADSLAATCHLAIIGKPGIALLADVEGLNSNFPTGAGAPNQF